MWPSCGASGSMNNAEVQNIKKQKQTKARHVALFLSKTEIMFLIDTLNHREGLLKYADRNLLGQKRFRQMLSRHLVGTVQWPVLGT